MCLPRATPECVCACVCACMHACMSDHMCKCFSSRVSPESCIRKVYSPPCYSSWHFHSKGSLKSSANCIFGNCPICSDWVSNIFGHKSSVFLLRYVLWDHYIIIGYVTVMQNLSGHFVLNVGEQSVVIWMKRSTYKNVKRSILKNIFRSHNLRQLEKNTLKKTHLCCSFGSIIVAQENEWPLRWQPIYSVSSSALEAQLADLVFDEPVTQTLL